LKRNDVIAFSLVLVVLGAASRAQADAGPRLALGAATSCLRQRDGHLVCWGEMGTWPGKLGTPSGLGRVHQASLGFERSCAVLDDGTVSCWSPPAFAGSQQPDGRVTPVAGVDHAVEVRVGAKWACARRANGAVLCWSVDAFFKQHGPPRPIAGLPPARGLTLGDGDGACALVAGGVWCWRFLEEKKPPYLVPALKGAVALAPARGDAMCALLPGGRVACTGDAEEWGLPKDLRDVRQLAVGEAHVCALLRDRTVQCWGSPLASAVGALGAAGLDDVVEIAAGRRHSCALRRDGSVWCWGLKLSVDGAEEQAEPTRISLAALAPEELADARLKALLPLVTPRDPASCAAAVTRHGRVLQAVYAGTADRGRPIDAATVFNATGIAQEVTALAALMLVADGSLALDDDVRKHVPDLPDYGATVTVRDLLYHTSGLRKYDRLLELAGVTTEDSVTTDRALAALSRQKDLSAPPGTEVHVLDSNYLVLGRVVERVAQQPLAELAARRIFAPLGMTHTTFGRPAGAAVAHGYEGARSQWATVGDGGLYATLDDLVRWEANLVSATVGPAKLLSAPGRLRDGAETTTTPGFERVADRDHPYLVSSWTDLGFHAVHLRFSADDVSVLLLCNDEPRDPVRTAWEMAALYTGAKLPAAPGPAGYTLTDDEHLRIEGSYRDRATGARLSIMPFYFSRGVWLKRDRLAYRLEPTGAMTFKLADEPTTTYEVLLPDDGPARLVERRRGAEQSYFADGLKAKPEASARKPFAGRFSCPELGVSMTLAEGDEDELVLSVGTRQVASLRLVYPDELVDGDSALTMLFTDAARDHAIVGGGEAGRLTLVRERER
jgi:CubicO group peptidase (beta-lactamase class C family)